MRAAQGYVREGKDWVVDIDIAKFFDHVNHDILMRRIAPVIRDKRILRLMGRYLRAGVLLNGVLVKSEEARRKAGRCLLCWRTSTWMRSIGNCRTGG